MKNTVKKQIIFILFVLILSAARSAMAVISVIDSANLSNTAKQVVSLGQQLQATKNQLEQAKQQYQALTGSRGLGSISYDQTLRNYLPQDLKEIYDLANGDYATINQQNFSGSIIQAQQNIKERSFKNIATNKAVSVKGYLGTNKRLDQIESLRNKINDTQDLKGIGELQARIEIEQASIENESNKLQLIRQLQVAERKLIQAQKHEISCRLLSSKITGMPKIK